MGGRAGSRHDRVGNQVDGIRGAGVLGLLVGVVIRYARALVVDDVLEDRAKAFGRRVDLRLRLLADANRLCIAAALEVEDSAVAPAVLVVADEPSRRVG